MRIAQELCQRTRIQAFNAAKAAKQIMTQEQDTSQGYTPSERALADSLFGENYETLKRIARTKRRRMAPSLASMTTEIVHECYFKLKGQKNFASRPHYLASAALAIRHVIIDIARRHRARFEQQHVAADEGEDASNFLPEYGESPEDILMIADLIERLEEQHPIWVQVLDARYFAGMTEEETAEMLSRSVRSVRRDWRDVRDWLKDKMGREG